MSKEFLYTDADYERVSRHIYRIAGISLGESRREMVYSRLSRELRRSQTRSVKEYLDRLDSAGAHEWTRFVNLLTTNLTSFFREAHHFKILSERILSVVDGPVRIWSCACATGEEPYSIGIACQQFYGDKPAPVSVLATDINTSVLQDAERGVYEHDRVQGMAHDQLRRYFWNGTGAYEGLVKIKDPIKRMVHFRMLNLMDENWGMDGKFDAIFCRNVMIYFDKQTQYRVLQKFVPLLKHPHGLLFAGHSEAFFNAKDLFAPIGATTYRVADAPAY